MNIRLFLLSVCLLSGIVHDVYTNQITLCNKSGNKLIFDTEVNQEVLGIPGLDINGSDVYGFVINAQESPMQFINKCDWINCMEIVGCRSKWLENGTLPSGSIAKRIQIYKLKNGVYCLKKTISAASAKRRSVIVPVDPDIDEVLNDHDILQQHHAAPLFPYEMTPEQERDRNRRVRSLYNRAMREEARINGIRSNNLPQNNDSESDSEREREFEGNYSYDSDGSNC